MTPTYIDRNLEPGEVVILRGRPSKSAALRRPVVLAIVFAILIGIDRSIRNSVVTPASHGTRTAGEIVVGLLLIFDFFAVILTTISAVTFLVTAQYAVTNHRVVAKYGVSKSIKVAMLLTKISGIKVNQGLLGRILDYGNVTVQSSGESRRIALIKSPKAFQSAILGQLNEARLLQGTAAYPLDVQSVNANKPQFTGVPVAPSAAVPLPPGTPAQWVRDPLGENAMRYWDGNRWTDHIAPPPSDGSAAEG